MKALKQKILDTQYKSIKLQGIAIDSRTPNDKTNEIRKQQQETYKKYDFFKKLDSALRKG